MTKAAISKLAVALALSAWAAPALATQSYCRVVKPTPDGSVALRAGPGPKFPVVKRLQPHDLVWVDTGACRDGLCDETRSWVFIEMVPRLDRRADNSGRAPNYTQGWIRAGSIHSGGLSSRARCRTELRREGFVG